MKLKFHLKKLGESQFKNTVSINLLFNTSELDGNYYVSALFICQVSLFLPIIHAVGNIILKNF